MKEEEKNGAGIVCVCARVRACMCKCRFPVVCFHVQALKTCCSIVCAAFCLSKLCCVSGAFGLHPNSMVLPQLRASWSSARFLEFLKQFWKKQLTIFFLSICSPPLSPPLISSLTFPPTAIISHQPSAESGLCRCCRQWRQTRRGRRHSLTCCSLSKRVSQTIDETYVCLCVCV